MRAQPHLVFVDEGKAAYPEIAAYQSFFQKTFEPERCAPDACANLNFDRPTVLWHIMGFYPHDFSKGKAVLIHDYRSLSVGIGARLKDRIKRSLNAKPHVRIFQNEAMRTAMGFQDDVRTLLLPMGVPSFCQAIAAEKTIDFAYCGAMSAERKTHEMIDSFLARFGTTKKLVLFGKPEAYLPKRYENEPSVVFAGSLPQNELFATLAHVRCAVNYFPNHFPHLVQTPTKFLEYAALGLRVIANEHPASRATASAYGLRAFWGPAHDMFRTVPDGLDWPDNAGVDPTPFLWPSVIQASGVSAALAALVGPS